MIGSGNADNAEITWGTAIVVGMGNLVEGKDRTSGKHFYPRGVVLKKVSSKMSQIILRI
jgi:hypothetical protein